MTIEQTDQGIAARTLQMAAYTYHGTVLLTVDGRLQHLPLDESTREAAASFAASVNRPLVLRDGRVVEPVRQWEGELSLRSDGFWGCAEPGCPDLVFNRVVQADWEAFVIRPVGWRPDNVVWSENASEAELAIFLAGATATLDTSREAAASPTPDGGWERIVVAADATFEANVARITAAIATLSPDGFVLVDCCRTSAAARAIVALACDGVVRAVTMPGLTQSPRFQVLRRHGPRSSPGASRVVLVAVYGDRSRLECAISRAAIADWAARMGAELMVVEGDLAPDERPLAKLHALEHVPAGARVLLLDTDLIVRDDTPDLFDIVPEESIGVFIEGRVCDRSQALRDTIDCFEVAPAGPYYANTGVLLLPASLAPRLRASAIDRTMYIDGMYEQNFLNAVFHERGYDVFDISDLFNCIPALTPQMVTAARILHYAGGSMVPQRLTVWEETSGANGIRLRIKRALTPKDVRVFEMWNARATTEGRFDRLYQMTLVRSTRSRLVLRDGWIGCELERDLGGVAERCDLGAVPAGDYALEVFCVAGSLARAVGVGDGGTTSVAERAAPGTLDLDVVSTVDEGIALARTSVEIRDGIAVVGFTLSGAQRLGCRFYGQDRVLTIFGLRCRAVAPRGPAPIAP